MDNIRTVKRVDLEHLMHDTFKSYSVSLDSVDVSVNSLYIGITFRVDNGDTDEINSINSALAELFELKVILSDPGTLLANVNTSNYYIPLVHPFNIVE